MHKRKSKKQQLIRRTLVYSIMTTAVIGVVIALVLVMLGYRLNPENALEQGGLVQFASRPTGATVTLGSATLGKKTPSKITAYDGDYTVTMNREGYKQWQKDITVVPGIILWLNYAKLIPEQIKTEKLLTLDDVAQAEAAPDGKKFAIRTKLNKYSVLDVSGGTPKSEDIVLPSGLSAGKSSKDSISSWDNENDRLLVKRTTGKKTEWIMIDTKNPANSLNVSANYGLSIKQARFDPRSSSRIYVQTADNSIRFLDTASDSLATTLATKVGSWSFIDDTALLYVTQGKKSGTRLINYLTLGETVSRTITKLNAKKEIYVAGGEYFSDVYVSLADTSAKELKIMKLENMPNSASQGPLVVSNVADQKLGFNGQVPICANWRQVCYRAGSE